MVPAASPTTAGMRRKAGGAGPGTGAHKRGQAGRQAGNGRQPKMNELGLAMNLWRRVGKGLNALIPIEKALALNNVH